MCLYKGMVDKFKSQLLDNGMIFNEVENLFSVVPDEELSVLTNLFDTYSYLSHFYSEDELIDLKNYFIPEKVIDFYKYFSPKNNVTLYGDVRLLSLKDIKLENTELVPGALLVKYGLLTVATTLGGSAICMDLNKLTNNEPRVIIADHSIFNNRCIRVFEADPISRTAEIKRYYLSYEVIDRYCPQISETFSGFLENLSNKVFDDIEDYLE